jgi:predicted AAA+ superfamily ATPase
LVHALLGIRDREELLGHPVVGPSWEGWVLENVLNVLPPSARASFYRTSAGAEIDLVVELGPKQRWAIEVKRSLGDPAPSKGFYNGCEDIKATRRIVVYPGDETFKLNPTTEVMSLPSLLAEQALRG